jgi:hypothetical protein
VRWHKMITLVAQAVLLGGLAVRVAPGVPAVPAVPVDLVTWAVRAWAQAVPVDLVR